MISNPHPPRRDVGLERAKAIWAFRPGELVETLWIQIQDLRAAQVHDPNGILDAVAQVLAGDDLPPLRVLQHPTLRPAVPPRPEPDS